MTNRAAEIAFADQLRAAREAALRDAEAFGAVVHAVERLGSFETGKLLDLGKYKAKLESLAEKSPLATQVPSLYRGLLTPFSNLFDLVREARNDAAHQGASARHLTAHAIELALILEDALRSDEVSNVSDYMVRNPVCAELWHPIGFVRQQMLTSSFSYLPVLDRDGKWCLVSDRDVAVFLGADSSGRKDRLATLLEDSSVALRLATPIRVDASREEALKLLDASPLLVFDGEGSDHLLGIVTAFDLL